MLETDADRRNSLLALGGSDRVLIGSARVTALFQSDPTRDAFDEITVSGQRRTLTCLTSDAVAHGFAEGDRVTLPGNSTAFFIGDIQDDSGMSVIELRRE